MEAVSLWFSLFELLLDLKESLCLSFSLLADLRLFLETFNLGSPVFETLFVLPVLSFLKGSVKGVVIIFLLEHARGVSVGLRALAVEGKRFMRDLPTVEACSLCCFLALSFSLNSWRD